MTRKGKSQDDRAFQLSRERAKMPASTAKETCEVSSCEDSLNSPFYRGSIDWSRMLQILNKLIKILKFERWLVVEKGK